jgi:DNA invertase Pin-like site-specific DNA recombinase
LSSKKFAYGRVSTTEQNEDRQVLDFLEYGIAERDIFIDKQSGRTFNRTNYTILRDNMLRQGDLLVVKSIDRFGRNYSAIRTEWEYITKTIGADIVVLDTPILDTTQFKDLMGSVITDIVLAVLSFGAQLEVDTKSQAQREGIAAAHMKGVKFGRPKAMPKEWDVWYPKWKASEITAVECYKQMGISRSSFYRLVNSMQEKDGSSNI